METSNTPIRVVIRTEFDVLVVVQKGRILAEKLGFSARDQTAIAIAIAEVGRNIVKYAAHGEIILQGTTNDPTRTVITIIARDEGPGIGDIEQALQDGFSTGGGLGLGLPGAKRLMDTFEIDSEPEKGTTVTMKKWNIYDK
jgi:serine/threonine-protein kinase RsbT